MQTSGKQSAEPSFSVKFIWPNARLGRKAIQFCVESMAASGQMVGVDACTNLANSDWQPVQTNTLTTGTASFADPQWTNFPTRFYHLRSP
jgi:hypothetical protein